MIDGANADEEQLMELALEAGAEDVSETEGGWEILTEPSDFIAVKEAIDAAEIEGDRGRLREIDAAEMAQMMPPPPAAVRGWRSRRSRHSFLLALV